MTPVNYFRRLTRYQLGVHQIAQVHEAVLGDGSKVVLKIQRPQIKQIMAEDIALVKEGFWILILQQEPVN